MSADHIYRDDYTNAMHVCHWARDRLTPAELNLLNFVMISWVRRDNYVGYDIHRAREICRRLAQSALDALNAWARDKVAPIGESAPYRERTLP